MGINGLLPFLGKSSRKANVKEYAGSTVAIDAYCWLHKGAFGCAEKLVRNEPTTMYVSYCMKYVKMLLFHNIKPILVFDGQNLPAKLQTEKKRRESREMNRRKGQDLIKAGLVSEGENLLRRAIDVTHEMALEVMRECRRINVDCIVAPYEADAQLAYFNLQDIAQLVITEDSDLLVFGCKVVLFKMDTFGDGLLIEREKIPLSLGIRPEEFSTDKFRLMCILSGCDYIDSLPGIGLGKAWKFVKQTSTVDIPKAIASLPFVLNMKSLVVTEQYCQSVVAADHAFRCQLIFDPLRRIQVPMTDPRNGEEIVGDIKDPVTAYQLALGNLHPKNLKKVDSYDPDAPKSVKPVNREEEAMQVPHKSIWCRASVGYAKEKGSVPLIVPVSVSGDIRSWNSSAPAIKRGHAYDPDPDNGDDFVSWYMAKRRISEYDKSSSLSGRSSETAARTESSSSVIDLLHNMDSCERMPKPAYESDTTKTFSVDQNQDECDEEWQVRKRIEDFLQNRDNVYKWEMNGSNCAISPTNPLSPLTTNQTVLETSDIFKISENDSGCYTDSASSIGIDEALSGSFDEFDDLPSSVFENSNIENRPPSLKAVGTDDIRTPVGSRKGLFRFNSAQSRTQLFSKINTLDISSNSPKFNSVGEKDSNNLKSFSASCAQKPKMPVPIIKAPVLRKASLKRSRVGLSRPKLSNQSPLTQFGFQIRSKAVQCDGASTK